MKCQDNTREDSHIECAAMMFPAYGGSLVLSTPHDFMEFTWLARCGLCLSMDSRGSSFTLSVGHEQGGLRRSSMPSRPGCCGAKPTNLDKLGG